SSLLLCEEFVPLPVPEIVSPLHATSEIINISEKNSAKSLFILISSCKLKKCVQPKPHTPKNATPIVAKQIFNTKGNPNCHSSGITFLPNSIRMAKKYYIPLKYKRVTH
ncbi:MAG: hypothetical protein ACI3XM_06775, partial [Eubacteriales bacterium]